MKNLFLFIFSFAVVVTAAAQDGSQLSLDEQVYRAYLSNDTGLWEIALQRFKSQHGDSPSGEALLQLAKLEYGLVGLCMGNDNEAKAKEHLASGERHLKAYLKKQKDSAEANALMSGLLGFRIAFSPVSGMWLGPRSNSHLRKAMNADKDCAQSWKQKASSLFHTPAAFGGDLEESVRHFRKAAELFEANSSLTHNWEYLDTLAWLGQAQSKSGDRGAAVQTYQKALRIEPEFGWVKHRLLPAVSKAN